MSIPLRLFPLLIGFGASLGLWRIYRSTKPGQALSGVLTGLWVLCGAGVGGRVGYVLIHHNYFSSYPEETVRFWQGGLNAFGVAAGALLFSSMAAILLRQKLWNLLDRVSLMTAPIGIATWLGLWGEGIAYGKALTASSLRGIPVPDESGIIISRFPLQIVAGISLLASLLLVEKLTRKKRAGIRFAFIGSILSVHTAVFSMLRADPVAPLWGERSDTWLSILFSVLFIVLGILLMLTKENRAKIEKGEEWI